MSEALQELKSLLLAGPTVTWAKPDGNSNTYHCIHEDSLKAWARKWGES